MEVNHLIVNSLNNRQRGGAALEYIIISLCSLTIAGLCIGFMGKTIQDKIRSLSEKHNIEVDLDEWEDMDW